MRVCWTKLISLNFFVFKLPPFFEKNVTGSLYKLPKRLVRKLLSFKNRSEYIELLKEIEEVLIAKGKSLKTYSIDEQWYVEHLQNRLDALSAAFRLEYATDNYNFGTSADSLEDTYDFSQMTVSAEESLAQQNSVIQSPHQRIRVKAGP